MDSSTEKRLDRIDDKLNQIQEVLVSMARIEERQATFEDFMKGIGNKFDKLDSRVDRIEKSVDSNSMWSSVLSKASWLLIAAIFGAMAPGWLI